MVLSTRRDVTPDRAQRYFDALTEQVGVSEVAIDEPTGRIAVGMLALGAIVGIGVPFLTHVLGTHGHGVAKGATPPPVAHS